MLTVNNKTHDCVHPIDKYLKHFLDIHVLKVDLKNFVNFPLIHEGLLNCYPHNIEWFFFLNDCNVNQLEKCCYSIKISNNLLMNCKYYMISSCLLYILIIY